MKCAYEAHDSDAPQGIKGHETKKPAISIVEIATIDPHLMCQAANWAPSSTFAKYYMLNLIAKAQLDFGRRVLKLAGSCRRLAETCSLAGYHIPKKKSRHPH